MDKIDIKKILEILRLKFCLKLSHRTIGRALKISPSSVSHLTVPFVQRSLNWAQLEKMDDEEIKDILRPKPVIAFNPGFIKPDFEKIHQELKKKTVTLQLLWEEYKDTYKEKAYGRSKFCQLYRTWQKKIASHYAPNA
jgi:transposase